MDIVDKIQELIVSSENARRLAVQSALNRKEKIFGFNAWQWGGGLSVGDATSPVPGLCIREMALRLGEVDASFAEAVVRRQLESQISFFDSRISDVPVATQVFTNMGLSWLYRESPLGEQPVVDSATGAFIHEPVLQDSCAEWTSLPRPTLEVDEALHKRRMELYRGLTAGLLPFLDDLIPLPLGSVFGTASRLRGDTNLLMDFRLCPDDVHALMRYLNEVTIEYNRGWAEFMEGDEWSKPVAARRDYCAYIFSSVTSIGGVPMYIAGEDHVSADMFSEDDYLEFVFPYQKELLQEFPTWYVHSCGNLGPFFKHIAKLPNVHRVHVSPWSDLGAAVEALRNSVILELHQPLDFDTRSGNEIDRMVDEVIDLCAGTCTVDIVLPDTENGRRYRERVLRRSGQQA